MERAVLTPDDPDAIAKSDASYKEAVVQIRKLYKRKTRFMSKKKIKTNNLEEVNTALRVLLKRRDDGKGELEKEENG